MSPVTHFFAGWLLAAPTRLSRREKAAIVCAGVAPDLDGLGAIPELLTRNSSHPLLWFSQYHHSLHTLCFALVVTAAAWIGSGCVGFSFTPELRKEHPPAHPAITALLAFLSFHLHLFCDLIGSRGPDGYIWPIPYFAPFSSKFLLSWHGQWALNGWQNLAGTSSFLLITLWIAAKTGNSPLALFSDRANRTLVDTLQRRFGSGIQFRTTNKYNCAIEVPSFHSLGAFPLLLIKFRL